MKPKAGGKPTCRRLDWYLACTVLIGSLQQTLSSPSWVVGLTQESAPTSQLPTDPTWFEPLSRDARRAYGTGLPSTEGDVFITTSFTTAFINNIRLFSRTGTLNLLYNSD